MRFSFFSIHFIENALRWPNPQEAKGSERMKKTKMARQKMCLQHLKVSTDKVFQMHCCIVAIVELHFLACFACSRSFVVNNKLTNSQTHIHSQQIPNKICSPRMQFISFEFVSAVPRSLLVVVVVKKFICFPRRSHRALLAAMFFYTFQSRRKFDGNFSTGCATWTLRQQVASFQI